MPRKAARLDTATTWPASRATIAGSAAPTVTQAAVTFTSRIFLTQVQSILRALVGQPTPALAMTRSSAPPEAASASWIDRTSSSASVTSIGTGTTRRAGASAASASSSGLRRATAYTVAPSCA